MNKYEVLLDAAEQDGITIGRDYELYVGYSYFSRGYEVEYYGTIQKLEDMGRDLIVKKIKKLLLYNASIGALKN